MKVIIAGSRDVSDYVALVDLLHDSGFDKRVSLHYPQRPDEGKQP